MKVDSNRRRIVLTSAAVVAAAGVSRLPWAQTAKAAAFPTVDSLTVRVLTDSSYDTPQVQKSKWVRITRAPTVYRADVRRTIHSEWGLSLALESKQGADTRNVMLDFGYTPQALLNNMEIMGVDGGKMHGLIVSHGHYDHFGGLLGFLERSRKSLPADLTLHVGGEDNFCTRKISTGTPGHFTDWGVLDRAAIEAQKVRIVTCEKPTVVSGHAFTTGWIRRTTFEKVMPGNPVAYFKENGKGCDIPELNAKAGGKPAFDEHLHEHGTCYNLRDRGLVVISSCGHGGILNTVRTAQQVTGIAKVHAVMGGFHLFPATAEYLRQAMAELKEINPDVVIPMHCSGPGFLNAMREAMADRLLTSTTGTTFHFGA